MAVQTDDWKLKYRELTAELEQVTTDSQRQASALGQIINSMTMVLEGEDEALDRGLNELKAALKNGASAAEMTKIARRLDKQVRAWDESRNRNARAVMGALQRWIVQLREATQNPPTLKILEACEARSAHTVEAAYELPALLSDLIELQLTMGSVVKEGMTSEHTDEAVPKVDQADMDRLLRTVAQELSALVAGLYLPPAEAEQGRHLVALIEKGFLLPQLPALLRQVIQLVSKVGGYESRDFEEYLRNLSAQLSEVETVIRESNQERESGRESQQTLNQAVRSNVAHLSSVMKSSDDLIELKQAVAERLKQVVTAVDSFRKTEDDREQRLQARYDALLAKVARMEMESREVQVHMEEERARAATDTLTRLPNRGAYERHISEELARWERYQTPFSLVVCDIDLFKRINDGYGHLAGDKVLRLISKVIKNRLRTTDFIGRYGGEEFVIIMPSTQAGEAQQAAEKIRQAVEGSPFNFHGQPVTVTMSFGVAEIAAEDDAESIFCRADEQLYRAKANGRNQVCCVC